MGVLRNSMEVLGENQEKNCDTMIEDDPDNIHFARLWSRIVRIRKQNNLLDSLYGDLAFPTEIYDWELDKNRKLIKPNFTLSIPSLAGEKFEETINVLSQDQTYNWIIDEYGWLHIGNLETISYTGAVRQLGHPTLIDGGQGRIAGELKYSNNQWELSNLSGRYSIDKDNRTGNHLKNVVELMISKNFINSNKDIIIKK